MVSDKVVYNEIAIAIDQYDGFAEVYGLKLDTFDGEFPVSLIFEDMVTGEEVKFQISKLPED